MKIKEYVMVDTVDYQQAVADLEESLQNAADHAHHLLVLYDDGNEDRRHQEMQKVYVELDKARARGMTEIDRIFSKVETIH